MSQNARQDPPGKDTERKEPRPPGPQPPGPRPASKLLVGERIGALCRNLLPEVDSAEARGCRCAILARVPAEPDKAAIGFVLANDVEIPRDAFASSPDLERIIRAGIDSYKIGEELPVVAHVVGLPPRGPRVEYILFRRPGLGQ
jgi:hypothetical protein